MQIIAASGGSLDIAHHAVLVIQGLSRVGAENPDGEARKAMIRGAFRRKFHIYAKPKDASEQRTIVTNFKS
jgi:hypothetical protein